MRWPGACLPGARPPSSQATWQPWAAEPHTAQVRPRCRAIPTHPDAIVDAVRSNGPRELGGEKGYLLHAGASPRASHNTLCLRILLVQHIGLLS